MDKESLLIEFKISVSSVLCRNYIYSNSIISWSLKSRDLYFRFT